MSSSGVSWRVYGGGFCCSGGKTNLLVVSTATVEVNEALNLRSPVVLDGGFSARRAFGATGTPSAVLVDPEGRIPSEVAVGGLAVLALVGSHQ